MDVNEIEEPHNIYDDAENANFASPKINLNLRQIESGMNSVVEGYNSSHLSVQHQESLRKSQVETVSQEI